MGLTGFLKKKPLSDEEKQHQAKVKEVYDKARREAELEAAKEQGKQAGSKVGSAKKGGLLSTIGNIAEGALYGINKGADAFNKGVGIESLDASEDNNDLLGLGSRGKKKRKKTVNVFDY